MRIIHLETQISAPIDLVFDMARDVDVHTRTVPHTRERASGMTDGRRVGPNDTVTFEAVHFGIRQPLTARITAFEPPTLFADEMVQGAFHSLRHTHQFEANAEGTLMRDCLEFTSPLGLLGRIADRLFLEGYMRRFLQTRNANLKRLCEEAAAKSSL